MNSSSYLCTALHAPYNISGHMSIPWPQPPNAHASSAPSGNYTLSTYFNYDPLAGPNSLNQSFGATNSSGGFLDLQPVPYQGCIFIFGTELSTSMPPTAGHVNEGDQASCTAALSADCMSQITDTLTSSAMNLSQTGSPDHNPCGSMRATLSSLAKCQSKLNGVYISATLFNPTFDANLASLVESCPNQNFTQPGTLAGYDFPASNVPVSQQYSELIGRVTPLATVAWINASSNGGAPWAKSQVACISTDDVLRLAKSASSGAAATTSATGGSPWSVGRVMVAALVVNMLSFLFCL